MVAIWSQPQCVNVLKALQASLASNTVYNLCGANTGEHDCGEIWDSIHVYHNGKSHKSAFRISPPYISDSITTKSDQGADGRFNVKASSYQYGDSNY